MSKKPRPIYRKKRFYLMLALLGWLSFVHSGCMTFRKSDKKQTAYITERGGPKPSFGFFEGDGRKLHYTETQIADSTYAVLFVHGSPGSSDNFLDYFADSLLLDSFSMVTVDRPGFGYSGYSHGIEKLEDQSRILKPLVKHMKDKYKYVYLVGHSLGGPLVGRMAADYPELVDGIIVAAGSADPKLEPTNWYRYILKAFPVCYMIPGSFRASNTELIHHKRDLKALTPLWANIKAPIIVLQGTKDMFVPEGNAYFIRDHAVNADTVDVRITQGMNHFFVWVRPELIRNALLDIRDMQK